MGGDGGIVFYGAVIKGTEFGNEDKEEGIFLADILYDKKLTYGSWFEKRKKPPIYCIDPNSGNVQNTNNFVIVRDSYRDQDCDEIGQKEGFYQMKDMSEYDNRILKYAHDNGLFIGEIGWFFVKDEIY
jgi:hypothetical protein